MQSSMLKLLKLTAYIAFLVIPFTAALHDKSVVKQTQEEGQEWGDGIKKQEQRGPLSKVLPEKNDQTNQQERLQQQLAVQALSNPATVAASVATSLIIHGFKVGLFQDGGPVTVDLSSKAIGQIKTIVNDAINSGKLTEHNALADSLVRNCKNYFRNEVQYNNTCGINTAIDDMEQVDEYTFQSNLLASRLNTTSFGISSAPSYQLMVGIKMSMLRELIAIRLKLPSQFQDPDALRSLREQYKGDASRFHYTLSVIYPQRLYEHMLSVHRITTRIKWSTSVRPQCNRAARWKHYTLNGRQGQKKNGGWQTIKSVGKCDLCKSSCRHADIAAENQRKSRARALVEQRKLEFLTEEWADNVEALSNITNTPLDELVFV
jgi:hypothetical protein